MLETIVLYPADSAVMAPILEGCPFEAAKVGRRVKQDNPPPAKVGIVLANHWLVGQLGNRNRRRYYEKYPNGVLFIGDSLLLKKDTKIDVPTGWSCVVGDGPHEKYPWMPVGYSAEHFKPFQEKPIDVLFVGRVKRCELRKKVIASLNETSFKVITMDSYGSRTPYQAYCELLSSAKIIVNVSFDKAGEHIHQYKARVTEAGLAGACLLESENDITPLLFEEGSEYVAWQGPWDLIDKCAMLLQDHRHRESVARRLYEHVSRDFTAEKFWPRLREIASADSK